VAYTSDKAGQVIKKHNILHYGFQLMFDDRLPKELKRKMHENPKIGWSIPRKLKKHQNVALVLTNGATEQEGTKDNKK
jgi:hypothetical protein